MLALKDKSVIEDFLHRLPLFAGLKPSVIDNFSQYAQLKTEKKGAVIFLPDTANDKFYIVVSGWVKLFRETLGGEEAVVDVLTAGHSFSEIGLSGTETVPYGAAAVEEAELIVLPRFLLAEEVMRNSVFGLAVLRTLTGQKMQRDLEIEHRTVQSAPQRIGCFLLKLCGDKTSGAVTLHLPYDKTVIAGRLGMQPETFSRALAKLRDETDLCIHGASVEINDVQKLVQYTCAACSSNFPCKED